MTRKAPETIPVEIPQLDTAPRKYKIPDTLSAFARDALNDLRKCEKDPRYKINMSSWHYPTMFGTCSVCLAGSVIAQRFDVPSSQEVAPFSGEFPGTTERERAALRALDYLRCGYVTDAFFQFYQAWDPKYRMYDPATIPMGVCQLNKLPREIHHYPPRRVVGHDVRNHHEARSTRVLNDTV